MRDVRRGFSRRTGAAPDAFVLPMAKRANDCPDEAPAGMAAAEEAAQAAGEAGLVHVCDDEPGIRRRRAGRGFAYHDAKGRLIRDEATLQRIRALAIPPAYEDVWICADPNGHLQATGRDDRGRKQYRYHERWSEARGENKYGQLIAFAERLPDIRARVDADMRRQGLVREKILASVVWLLDTTLIRVGNERYTRDNKSFGLTTLRDRHVDVGSNGLKFAFTGKSGKSWKLSVRDRRIARIVRACQDIPGQRLFQYLDDEGEPRPIHSQDVNDYIRDVLGNGFSAKHFRTWAGTVMAAAALLDAGPFESKTQARHKLNRAVDQVAAQLVNTRAVARRCYIHPAVIEAFDEGTLAAEIKAAARRHKVEGLKDEESVMLHFLKAHAGKAEGAGKRKPAAKR